MAGAAFNSTVKVAADSVALAAAPTTKRTANTVYQITDATKRILNPSVPVVVEVDADGAGAGAYAVAPASTYELDYLYGTVTFRAEQPAAATVRISGAYLETVDVADAQEFSVSLSRDLQDSTVFSPDGYRTRTATLRDATGTIGGLAPIQRDLNEGGDAPLTLEGALANGAPIMVETHLSATGDKFRAWVLLESASEQFTPAALYTSSISWQAARVEGLTGPAFGFGT